MSSWLRALGLVVLSGCSRCSRDAGRTESDLFDPDPDDTGTAPGATDCGGDPTWYLDVPFDEDTCWNAELPAATDGPCSDGSWAGWNDPDRLVHVSATGDDATGDGSAGAPFATVAAALLASRGRDPACVAVGPGTFEGPVQLKRPGTTEHRIALSGCGTDETTLVGGLERQPAVALAGSATTVLRRVRVVGGQGGVAVRDGALALLEDVAVSDTRRRGVSIAGKGTRALLRRVRVSLVMEAGRYDPYGWGVSLACGQARLEDVELADNSGFGLFGDRGTLSAQDLVVRGVRPNLGNAQGAGVYLMHMGSVELVDCAVEDVASAGIELVDTVSAWVERCTVTGARASASGAGDGILLRRAFRPFPHRGQHRATLWDNTVTGSARMGIAAWGVYVELSGNTAGDDNGHAVEGTSIFVDPEAGCSSSDPWQPLDRDVTPVGPPGGRHGRPQPGGHGPG